jgi:hypothetical protein
VFMVGSKILPIWPAVAVAIVEYIAVAWAILAWSRRPGWDDRHRLALAAGALLTYAWHAFTMRPVLGDGPVVTPVSHAVFALAVLALLAIEVRRLPKPTKSVQPVQPVQPVEPVERANPATHDLGSSTRGSLDMPRV